MLPAKTVKSFPNDTLKGLFLDHISQEDCDGLEAKTALLQQFSHELEELDCNNENQSNLLHWASIFSGFSGAIALSAVATIPVFGVVLAVAAVGSAGVTIAGTQIRSQKISDISKKLKRYTLALKSADAKNWAMLWHVSGEGLFLESLVTASKGTIDHQGKLTRLDNKPPLNVAMDYCAERLGITRPELIAKAGTTASTTAPTVLQPKPEPLTLLQSESPTVLQSGPVTAKTTAQDYEQNAVSIIDSLVLQAEKKTLGGCVIIAAPGAGKTTFLGTAWGRLKQHHGDRLRSLAVVVKKSDLPFFKAFATKALCVKDNPVNVAVEIIKFVDFGMKAGKITRVFLDDFLTMNSMFDDFLSGVFIEPNSYYISDKKEIGSVPLAKHLWTTLNEAWLVGREYNLCLWVSSHSPNLDSLPFCGSRDSRSVGDIIFLAKNGKREFLELSLSNAHLISNTNKRQELKTQLDNLDVGDSPIVLSNSNNWMLGIVPEFINDEYQGYRNQCLDSVDSVVDPEQDNVEDTERQQLEYLFKLPSVQPPTLSKIATTVLEIIKSGNPPVKFEAIRTSRKWEGNRPTSATEKEAIEELIAKELIEGDNEIGYIPVS